MLAGNPYDQPDGVSDCMTLPVERDPRAREEMGRADPRPPPHQGWTSARATAPYITSLELQGRHSTTDHCADESQERVPGSRC